MPAYPMELINSKNWYITLPSKLKATPDTVKMPDLATYSDEFFHLNESSDGVVFKAPSDGATTKNSKNPRSELREMTSDGKTQAAWSSADGTHSMEIEQSIDAVPIGSKPHVVVGQIHDANDDVTVFRWEGNVTGDRSLGKLWITTSDTSHGHLVDDALKLGTRFRVGFRVANGVIAYTYNGQPLAYLQNKKIVGCYFKAGSYNQSGGNITRLPNGEADYAEVTIYALQVCHDGVCTGRAPGDVLPPVKPPVEEPDINEGTSIMNIWISPEQLAALPTSGAAWNNLLKDAGSSWGSADLSDNNSKHDVLTLAGALVAVRTNDNAIREIVIAGLKSAMVSKLARALELSRGLQSYIIAADIIGYRDPAFIAWVGEMVTKSIQGHSGGSGVIGTAEKSSNNWGGMARAALAAAAAYTGNAEWKAAVITAHRAFIGAPAPGNKMTYTDTDWHAGAPQAGINVASAQRGNVNLSGVLAEDWRRAAGYKWPPSVSGYMWEGMQGLIVCAAILHRMGWVAFDEGDNAIVRAMDMLYGTGAVAANSPAFKNPAASDDTWIPWLVNSIAGTNYPTAAAVSGKGVGYTDWTHAGRTGEIPTQPEEPEEPPVVDPPVDPPPPTSNEATLTIKGSLVAIAALKAFVAAETTSLRVA